MNENDEKQRMSNLVAEIKKLANTLSYFADQNPSWSWHEYDYTALKNWADHGRMIARKALNDSHKRVGKKG